ncbi:hypothetical protein BZA70DRAFT_19934 [Myxozyma melibiosi]|uniref:CFEM domain-containing protein n=1 Tax=Myxozyma melibiosi TaxID=54550 RepID=A0ABR1FCM7_9ASCO
MRSISRAFALLLLSYLVAVVAAVSDAPSCFQPCIDNTKIISPCSLDDTECYCRDESYQSALYGCLYSQCTSKELLFAQNMATSQCVKFNVQPGANPHIAKRFDVRNYRRDGYSSGMSLSSTRLSSSRLSSSRFSSYGYSSSMPYGFSSAVPVSSAVFHAEAPAHSKHIVKRMEVLGMNDCGQSCFYSKLLVAGCDPTDLSCVCSAAYFNAVTDCLVDNCYDQIPLAFKTRLDLCAVNQPLY